MHNDALSAIRRRRQDARREIRAPDDHRGEHHRRREQAHAGGLHRCPSSPRTPSRTRWRRARGRPQRLRRMAELQERVLRSGFQEAQKNQMCLALDAVALRIEARSAVPRRHRGEARQSGGACADARQARAGRRVHPGRSFHEGAAHADGGAGESPGFCQLLRRPAWAATSPWRRCRDLEKAGIATEARCACSRRRRIDFGSFISKIFFR